MAKKTKLERAKALTIITPEGYVVEPGTMEGTIEKYRVASTQKAKLFYPEGLSIVPRYQHFDLKNWLSNPAHRDLINAIHAEHPNIQPAQLYARRTMAEKRSHAPPFRAALMKGSEAVQGIDGKMYVARGKRWKLAK